MCRRWRTFHSRASPRSALLALVCYNIKHNCSAIEKIFCFGQCFIASAVVVSSNIQEIITLKFIFILPFWLRAKRGAVLLTRNVLKILRKVSSGDLNSSLV